MSPSRVLDASKAEEVWPRRADKHREFLFGRHSNSSEEDLSLEAANLQEGKIKIDGERIPNLARFEALLVTLCDGVRIDLARLSVSGDRDLRFTVGLEIVERGKV